MFACLYAPALPAASAALLVNCACGFSPRVEETDPQTVTLDIAGLDRLLGPPLSIANAIARRLDKLDITNIHFAIASNPDAALHAARGLPGITLIPPGEEARVLAGLPLSLLSAPPDLAETLRVWGLRTFGDLAALPEAGLAERLGSEGLRLQQLARGSFQRPLVPSIPPDTFGASLELDHPVAQLEPLLFLLARLLEDLLTQLHSHGLAANEIRLRLQ
ncbi:MAG TPA: hypothetical protein VEU62_13325, partial [Bryobacterales bacterium]|nr:hypothetical protein [Bryobacterales bacterium]